MCPLPETHSLLLSSRQVSELSPENHQFCNIKVSSSRKPCPHLPVGKACCGPRCPSPASPHGPTPRYPDDGTKPPSQMHTGCWVSPAPIGSAFWRPTALPDECSEHRSGGPLDLGPRPGDNCLRVKGVLKSRDPAPLVPTHPLFPPTSPVRSATSMALMEPPPAGSSPRSTPCSSGRALASPPLLPSCRASCTGRRTGRGPDLLPGQS